jgi:membrane protein implicated in regulation of membrane protease activity
MTNVLLGLAALATLAVSIWLAFENNAVMALPLAIVFAGLLRTLVRRAARRGTIPAEVAIRRMTTNRCESCHVSLQLPRCIAASRTL